MGDDIGCNMKLMFGYATLADPQYIRALLGRLPTKLVAYAVGYGLGIQRFNEMPDLVRKVSSQNWKPSEFRSYFAHKTNNPKNLLRGVIWEINEHDEAIIDDWEFLGIWYHKEIAEVLDRHGKRYKAIIYCVNGPGTPTVNPTNPFPVNKAKMLVLARNNNLAARRARGEK
jgi:hypothetical protein